MVALVVTEDNVAAANKAKKAKKAKKAQCLRVRMILTVMLQPQPGAKMKTENGKEFQAHGYKMKMGNSSKIPNSVKAMSGVNLEKGKMDLTVRLLKFARAPDHSK